MCTIPSCYSTIGTVRKFLNKVVVGHTQVLSHHAIGVRTSCMHAVNRATLRCRVSNVSRDGFDVEDEDGKLIEYL